MRFSWLWNNLNICMYSRAAGSLKYMQELGQFKAECPGLPSFSPSLAADSLVRKKVHRLQSEQRELYSTFEAALLEVLHNHKYLLERRLHQSCSGHCRPQETGATLPTRSSGRKSGQDLHPCMVVASAESATRRQLPSTPGRSSRLRRTSSTRIRRKISTWTRIPDSEWKLISQAAASVSGPKRRHYFNSSMGCALAEKCRFKHNE